MRTQHRSPTLSSISSLLDYSYISLTLIMLFSYSSLSMDRLFSVIEVSLLQYIPVCLTNSATSTWEVRIISSGPVQLRALSQEVPRVTVFSGTSLVLHNLNIFQVRFFPSIHLRMPLDCHTFLVNLCYLNEYSFPNHPYLDTNCAILFFTSICKI